MTRYELWESIDGAEVAIILADDPDKPASTTDTDGRPMKLVMAFSAAGWDAAAQVRNDHYGWGPYKPWP